MDGRSSDSDEDLQEAFAAGKLKPGLNIVREKIIRPAVNDEEAMLAKLEAFRVDLPWLERLDLTCKPAALAPELREEIDENKSESAQDRLVEDDFKRETYFYRIAQEAVLEGLPLLRQLNIPTKRPADYMAQMVKSDQQMDRVRKSLLQQKTRKELSEKARKHRQLRKQAKQNQVEAQQRKAKEKREVLEKVKQFRKGKEKNLDFLEDMKEAQRQGKPKSNSKKSGPSARRERRNAQYGFGGRKKGKKRNTADSTADMAWSGANSGMKDPRKRQFGTKKSGPNRKSKSKRPGKMARQKMKSKK